MAMGNRKPVSPHLTEYQAGEFTGTTFAQDSADAAPDAAIKAVV